MFNIPYWGHIWLCVGKMQFIQYILQPYYFHNCTFALLSNIPVFDRPAVSNPHQTQMWNIWKYTFLHTTWSSDQLWIYWPTIGLQPELPTPVPSRQSAAKSQWCICCLQTCSHNTVFSQLHPSNHLPLQFQWSTETVKSFWDLLWVMKTSDFGEDTELLSLVETKPLFWDKTDDIYRLKKRA